MRDTGEKGLSFFPFSSAFSGLPSGTLLSCRNVMLPSLDPCIISDADKGIIVVVLVLVTLDLDVIEVVDSTLDVKSCGDIDVRMTGEKEVRVS